MIPSVDAATWLVTLTALAGALAALVSSLPLALVLATGAVIASIPLARPALRQRVWPLAATLGVVAAVLATRAWLVPLL